MGMSAVTGVPSSTAFKPVQEIVLSVLVRQVPACDSALSIIESRALFRMLLGSVTENDGLTYGSGVPHGSMSFSTAKVIEGKETDHAHVVPRKGTVIQPYEWSPPERVFEQATLTPLFVRSEQEHEFGGVMMSQRDAPVQGVSARRVSVSFLSIVFCQARVAQIV